jgi:hypothetical protein
LQKLDRLARAEESGLALSDVAKATTNDVELAPIAQDNDNDDDDNDTIAPIVAQSGISINIVESTTARTTPTSAKPAENDEAAPTRTISKFKQSMLAKRRAQ